MRSFARFSLALLAFAATAGCSSDSNPDDTDADEAPVTEGTWFRPGVADSWYWQLTGNVLSEDLVDTWAVDLFATSELEIARLKAGGGRVLCTFSAGRFDPASPDAGPFDAADLGAEVAGTNKQRWLNVRSPRLRDAMGETLVTARKKGCSGVVPTHADNYLYDTGFTIQAGHQLTYVRWLYNEAHRNRLSVGLVNNGGQVAELIDYVDFAVVERCQERGDCALFAPFIAASKPVFNAEYKALYVTDPAARQTMCAAANTANFRTIVLAPTLDGSVRLSCDG